MVLVYNRAYVNTATTGTGTLTLGLEVSDAFCTFAEAGVQDGDTVTFVIEEGDDFQICEGVYTATGTTLTRATTHLSKIAGTAGTSNMSLSGSATVRIVAIAEYVPGTELGSDLDAGAFDINNLTQVLLGTTAGLSGVSGNLQVVGTSAASSSMALGRYAADANDGDINFYKSRNASVGSHTVVAASDALGSIGYHGSDGTNYITAAKIQAFVDGTPGTNDMPGRIAFSTTADGASSPTENMSLNADGSLTGNVTASQSEQESGSSVGKIVTPGRQQYHPSACKVWIMVDQTGTQSISASYNVTSITDNGTGLTTVTIATDFSSANYAIVNGPQESGGYFSNTFANIAAGSYQMRSQLVSGGSLYDSTHRASAAFGDQ